MEIKTGFQDGGEIPEKYTCDGENLSPEITIEDIPEDTISLVLIFHDPDAPMPGGFTHWLLWNIPKTREIQQGVVPKGAIEGLNSGGEPGYTGPCPPSGVHHYELSIFALNTTLDLDEDSDKTQLEDAMQGSVLAEARISGIYASKQKGRI